MFGRAQADIPVRGFGPDDTMTDRSSDEAMEKARRKAEEARQKAREVHDEVKQINRDILTVAGGDRVVNWDKYFGMGYYGAVLSVIAGMLILVFPDLVPYIVAIYLIARGFMEALRHTRKQVAALLSA